MGSPIIFNLLEYKPNIHFLKKITFDLIILNYVSLWSVQEMRLGPR